MVRESDVGLCVSVVESNQEEQRWREDFGSTFADLESARRLDTQNKGLRGIPLRNVHPDSRHSRRTTSPTSGATHHWAPVSLSRPASVMRYDRSPFGTGGLSQWRSLTRWPAPPGR